MSHHPFRRWNDHVIPFTGICSFQIVLAVSIAATFVVFKLSLPTEAVQLGSFVTQSGGGGVFQPFAPRFVYERGPTPATGRDRHGSSSPVSQERGELLISSLESRVLESQDLAGRPLRPNPMNIFAYVTAFSRNAIPLPSQNK